MAKIAFKVLGQKPTSDMQFTRVRRPSPYDDIIAQVKKLKVGATLRIEAPKGVKIGRIRTNMGAAVRRACEGQVAGRVMTRVDDEGVLCISHMPKQGDDGARPGVGRKAAKKGKAKKAASKSSAPASGGTPAPAAPTGDPSAD